MKVISFSLWGNNPKYTIGAIRNAQLLQSIYPGWVGRFYIGSDVDKSIIDQIKSVVNTQVIMKTEANNWTGMFWRFEILCDDIECVIFRDTDSRLNMREKNAVDEWLLSDKTFHIMRDHPFHGFPILGGMWGFKKNSKYNLCDLLNMWSKENAYGADYNFLSKSIYPLINDDKVVHDPFFEKKPFPTKRIDTEFVGDVFDENDIRHPSFHTNIISRS